MTSGTSQGLFVVVAIVIFGIFVVLSNTLFGSEGLTNDLKNLFIESTAKVENVFDKRNGEPLIVSEGYFDFDLNNHTIVGYSDEGPKDVVIPETIQGVAVRKIGSDAFLNKGLTSVSFPETVTEIENSTKTYIGAFTGNKLGDFTLPSTLEKVGGYAFTNAGITSLTIEEGVTYIGSHAFFQNYFNDLKIPDSMETIASYAFTNVGLETVDLGNGVENIDGWAFRSNKIKTLTLPKSVKKLGRQFLSENGTVQKLNIPKELKHNIEKENNMPLINKAGYDPKTKTFINLVYFDDSVLNYY